MWGKVALAGRSLAIAAAFSAAVTAVPAGAVVVERTNGASAGASTRSAAAKIADALPAAVKRSEAARVDGQVVIPTLAPVGAHLSAIGTLGNPTIAVDPAGGFALDTPTGGVTIAPVWVDPAAPPAALVNGDSAVFAGVQSGANMLLRPTAVGVATVLQLDGPLAPTSFAFSVRVPRGETLRALDDGGVAIAAGDSRQARDDAAGTSAGGIDDPGALADPADQYSDGREAVRAADAATDAPLLAVVQPPAAEDAAGRPVETHFEVDGDIVKLAVDHHVAGLEYPLAVTTAAAAPDSWRRPWREAPGTGTAQPGPDGLLKVLLDDGEVLLTHGADHLQRDRVGPDEGLFDPELPNGGTDSDDPVEPLQSHSDGEEPLDGPSSSTTPGDVGLPPIPGGDPVCVAAGRKRLQIVYSSARPLDDRALLTRRIRRIVKGMNVKLYGEALDSGSVGTPRRLKVACTPSGRISVLQVESAGSRFEDVVSAAKRGGATEGNTKYLIFEEGPNPENDEETLVCGEANMYDDFRASARNLNNGRRNVPASGVGNDVIAGELKYEGGYGIVYGHPDGEEGCWNIDNALHENAHTMGAVQDQAPESNKRTHCDDGLDLMCYDDREPEEIEDGLPQTYREDVCPPGPRGARYDCNYDTYFDAAPEFDEYLDDFWNIGTRENLFLDFTKPADVDETFVFHGGRGDANGIWRESDDGKENPVPIAGTQECDGCFSSPYDPALSPDAQDVVFLGQASSPSCYDLRIMDADGSDKQSLWKCADRIDQFAARPAFSPSARTIIYDDAHDVWTMNRYGGDLQRVVDWGQTQYQATFSPDGEHVLFTSEGAPDGQRFDPDPVALDRSAIYRVDRDGSNPVKLTNFDDFARMTAARYSPDGTQIAFEGNPAGVSFQMSVYVMDADGSNVRRVSAGEARAPSWTPGGEIAYSELGADFTFDLVASRPDGTGHRTLVGDLDFAEHASFRQASPLYYP